jgi:hypothetical protein
MPRRIQVDVDDQTLELLRVLAKSYAIALNSSADRRDPVRAVIAHLVHSAAAGVRRPGSWERGWVEQAFGGGDWEEVGLTIDGRVR